MDIEARLVQTLENNSARFYCAPCLAKKSGLMEEERLQVQQLYQTKWAKIVISEHCAECQEKLKVMGDLLCE